MIWDGGGGTTWALSLIVMAPCGGRVGQMQHRHHRQRQGGRCKEKATRAATKAGATTASGDLLLIKVDRMPTMLTSAGVHAHGVYVDIYSR